MRLTTKGRFRRYGDDRCSDARLKEPVTLAAVSERQRISLSYLEQLFGKLRRHGLVDSVRGPGGGYNLARGADTMSVADIILAVDEPIDATQCGGRENCHDDRRCMTHDLWAGLNDHIYSYLHGVTLAQLVTQQKPAEVSVLQDHRPTQNARRHANRPYCHRLIALTKRQPDVQDLEASDLSRLLGDDAGRPARRAEDGHVPHRGIRQPGLPFAFVRLDRGGGRGRGARACRCAGRLRSQGTGVDIRRDGVDQPRAQRRGALLQGQGQASRHGPDGAQGHARYDAGTGARRFRGHVSRRQAGRPPRPRGCSRPRCVPTRSWSR